MNNPIKISSCRLEQNLNELAQIAKNSGGGIDRAFGSKNDLAARSWLQKYWKSALNQSVRIDSIANMWLDGKGSEPLAPIVIGSHHDAVPNGGMYDGAMGVLIATEVLQTLYENKIETRHPISLISFTGEEPNPYEVSTLGSKVVCGRLNREALEKLSNRDTGAPIQEAVLAAGGDITRADEALLLPGDISMFLECHIEQGRRLYDAGLSLAAVSCITGIYREAIKIIGEANHAGTTKLQDRHDALLAAAELDLAFEKILRDTGLDDVVGTIGYLKVFPNAANIIPESVNLILELRTCSEERRKEVLNNLTEHIKSIESARGVSIVRTLNIDQPEMPMHPEAVDAIRRGMVSIGEPEVVLTSMAGHDAANMARVTRSGMLFVQSIEGKSHCPEEKTDIYDIEKAANAMLRTVLILDKELDRNEDDL